MIISIFFIVASISIIIGTAIYIKKKNSFYKFEAKEKKSLFQEKKDIKSIWGIGKIENAILTVRNKHLIIIELESSEYNFLNDEEQANIDNVLIKIAKTFTNQVQFLSTTQRIDNNDKILAIQENIEKLKKRKEYNKSLVEYGESIIEYLENIMQEEKLYVKKSYLILSSNEEPKKAEFDLKEQYADLKENFLSIKVQTKLIYDIDTIEFIFRELNKNSKDKLNDIITKGGLDFYVQSKSKT